MGLRPTLHYLQVYSATWVTSLSLQGVPHKLLATGFLLKAIRGMITSTFHGIFRSQLNDY